MIETAKKTDWKTAPLPPERAELDIDATIDSDAWEQMKIGFVPKTDKDKWFLYIDSSDEMFVHRSSTGTCIFQVQFALHPSGEGMTITKAWANRNLEQYRNTKAGYDAKLLIYVIRRLLLKHDVPFPAPSSFPKSNLQTHEEHVMGSESGIKKRPGSTGFIPIDILDI